MVIEAHGGIMKAGSLVRVVVDGGWDYQPDYSFIAMITHIGPFLVDVYCPADQKRYQVPEEWVEIIDVPRKDHKKT